MMKRFLAILSLFCAAILLATAAAASPENEETGAFNGYLVRIEDKPRLLMKATRSASPAAVPDGCESLGGGLYYAETAEEAEDLSALGRVLYCEPNYILTVEDSAEGYEPDPWNLRSVGASSAWVHTDASGCYDRRGDGVTVAIVDTGVMASHPDLAEARILDTINLSGVENGVDNYHGTFIAGIMAAGVGNGIGTDGLTPDVTILPVCVTWSGGTTDVRTAVEGIRQAADFGADVITFSIGGNNDSAALREACSYAEERGVILVSSAGNYRSGISKSETNYMYPASYSSVVSVSACRLKNGEVEFDGDYSYFNDKVDVSAPGTDIVSLDLNGGTIRKSGTSFASPVVASMAVMARQADPAMDKDRFVKLLEESSVDLGDPGYDVFYGYGYVNIPAFLDALDAEMSGGETAAEAEPSFKKISLLLSGEIGVNFFMDLPETEGVDYGGSWMEFTVDGGDGRTASDAYDPDHRDKSGEYYAFTCYVNSLQMADTITAAFHYTDGEEEKTVTQTYSVREYLDAVAAGDHSSEMKALGAAIGDYGYYAQAYLTELHGSDPGAGHAAMPAGTVYTDSDYAEAAEGVSGQAVLKVPGNSGIEKVTYSLNLDSSTGITVYLKPAEGYDGEITAVIDDGGENAAVLQSDGRYRIQISGITAHRLADPHTVRVTAGKTFAFDISALSFADTILHAPTAGKAAKDLAVALYRYYEKANAYLASLD